MRSAGSLPHNNSGEAFDALAAPYDAWYDSREGKAIFEAELGCLRKVCGECRGRWLEVGVGSGRFAAALGIGEGLDPSPHMLELAARRGVRTCEGRAEKLPFPDACFDGVLLALTLCFLDDAGQALREIARTLRPEGQLLVGTLPADGPWGHLYRRKGSEGHALYSHATFRTAAEVVALAEGAGFRLGGAASTLFWQPETPPPDALVLKAGIVPEAGFLALLAERAPGARVGGRLGGSRRGSCGRRRRPS